MCRFLELRHVQANIQKKRSGADARAPTFCFGSNIRRNIFPPELRYRAITTQVMRKETRNPWRKMTIFQPAQGSVLRQMAWQLTRMRGNGNDVLPNCIVQIILEFSFWCRVVNHTGRRPYQCHQWPNVFAERINCVLPRILAAKQGRPLSISASLPISPGWPCRVLILFHLQEVERVVLCVQRPLVQVANWTVN